MEYIKGFGLVWSLDNPKHIEYCRLLAEFYIERYEKHYKEMKEKAESGDPKAKAKFERAIEEKRVDKEGNLTPERKKRIYVGLTGETAFHLALTYNKIPCVYNHPMEEWKEETDSGVLHRVDFEIPQIGKIDVKTATPNQDSVNVNVKDFEQEETDYIVACKFIDLKPKTVLIYGFMPKSQVENYEIIPADRPYRKVPLKDLIAIEKWKELTKQSLSAKYIQIGRRG